MCVISILKVVLIKRQLKENTINKLQDEFLVADKEIKEYTGNDATEVNNYYLTLVSITTAETKILSISGKDYRQIKKKQIISLIYFEKINWLLEAKWNNIILKESKFKIETELNIFNIMKKYK